MSSTLQGSAYALMFTLILGTAQMASADTFRCVDANGREIYTNEDVKATGYACTTLRRDSGVSPSNTAIDKPPIASSTALIQERSPTSIPLQRQGGTLVVPVLINNAVALNFVVDSGAADVTIPMDVVQTLVQAGILNQDDALGERTYTLADGSKMPSHTFRIQSMKVGDRVIENVTGGITPAGGHLLLGQSFLRRFKSWSIDNGKEALLLE